MVFNRPLLKCFSSQRAALFHTGRDGVLRSGNVWAVRTMQDSDGFWSPERQHEFFGVLGQPVGVSGVAVAKAIGAPTHHLSL